MFEGGAGPVEGAWPGLLYYQILFHLMEMQTNSKDHQTKKTRNLLPVATPSTTTRAAQVPSCSTSGTTTSSIMFTTRVDKGRAPAIGPRGLCLLGKAKQPAGKLRN